MKIVFFVGSLRAGGAERVAVNLANAWSSAGHEISLVTTFVAETSSFYEVSSQVDLLHLTQMLEGPSVPLLQPVAKAIAVRKIVRNLKPDVVVSFLSNVNVLSILACAFTDTPSIISERLHPGSSGNRYLEFACSIAYKFSSLLVVQTSRAASDALRLYRGLERVVAIPNPLPQGIERYTRSKRAHGDVGNRMIAIGRLAQQKRMSDLIAAFSSCAANNPEWRLDIFGEGPLRDQLQAQIEELGMASRIAIRGITADPWSELETSDVFVLASEFEGFPNALLEALRIGLPTIVTDCPSGPRELTDDGRVGLLVPVGDVAALTSAMQTLMSDRVLRQKLGDAGSEYVSDRYCLDAVLAQWDQAFAAVGVLA